MKTIKINVEFTVKPIAGDVLDPAVVIDILRGELSASGIHNYAARTRPPVYFMTQITDIAAVINPSPTLCSDVVKEALTKCIHALSNAGCECHKDFKCQSHCAIEQANFALTKLNL